MRRWITGILLGAVLVVSLAAAVGNRTEEDIALPPAQAAEEEQPVQRFLDVPLDAYYAPTVEWAVERGIAGGVGQGRFAPDELCTTAQAVTMLWRGMGSPEPEGECTFSDVPADAYYARAAAWAQEQGLVAGAALQGGQLCTRGMLVTMLWKLAGSPGEEEAAWNLRLVNPWNPLPQDYTLTLAPVGGGGYQVDQRCAAALEQMLDDCRAAGRSPAVCSAYRTWEAQERLFQMEVETMQSLGLTGTAAEEAAAQATAIPGTSEHQVGLAVDLVDTHYWHLDEKQATMPAQQWLMEHSWEYGFILRYPEDKSDLTGIIYEPWHYRYVGLEAARTIHEQGWCLEEYLQQEACRSAVDWAVAQGLTASTGLEDFAPDATCTRAQLVTFLHHALA